MIRRSTPLRRRPHTPAVLVRVDWPVLRETLWGRCGAYCEACGMRLNPDWWDAHHRLPRSRGGGHTPDNLVALHPGCHTIQPQAVHQRPLWAYQRGLLLRSGAQPALVPLDLPDRGPVLLTTYGTYLEDIAVLTTEAADPPSETP